MKPEAAPNATTRLLKFRVKCDPIGVGPTWHNLSLVDLANVPPALDGWTIRVRGGAVFFVSPKAWAVQGGADKPAADEETLIEFARSEVRFVWRSSDATACDKLSRFDIGPLKRLATPEDRARVVDAKELGDP